MAQNLIIASVPLYINPRMSVGLGLEPIYGDFLEFPSKANSPKTATVRIQHSGRDSTFQ